LIGRDFDDSLYYDGTLDEVRISDILRSDAWINTSYNNMNSPSTFSRVESEQDRSESDTYLNITVNNTGSIHLQNDEFTVLVDGINNSYVNLHPYLIPEKETYLLVPVTGSGTKRNTLITGNGKSKWKDYTI
jgi:archaellum component FlaF (FlaF/FlaG flagellin family)